MILSVALAGRGVLRLALFAVVALGVVGCSRPSHREPPARLWGAVAVVGSDEVAAVWSETFMPRWSVPSAVDRRGDTLLARCVAGGKVVLQKFAPEGRTRWSSLADESPLGLPTDLALRADNSVWVVGEGGARSYDGFAASFQSSGTLSLRTELGGERVERAFRVAASAVGPVVGYTTWNRTSSASRVIGLDSSLSRIWTWVPRRDWGENKLVDLAVTSEGSTLVLVERTRYGQFMSLHLVMLSSQGEVVRDAEVFSRVSDLRVIVDSRIHEVSAAGYVLTTVGFEGEFQYLSALRLHPMTLETWCLRRRRVEGTFLNFVRNKDGHVMGVFARSDASADVVVAFGPADSDWTTPPLLRVSPGCTATLEWAAPLGHRLLVGLTLRR